MWHLQIVPIHVSKVSINLLSCIPLRIFENNYETLTEIRARACADHIITINRVDFKGTVPSGVDTESGGTR